MSARGNDLGVLAQLRAGRAAVVITDGRADLVIAAELASVRQVAFMIRHTSGFLCVALPAADCGRLRLAPMDPLSTDPVRGSFTVSVDAATGIGTGISSADRARTFRLLGDATTSATDLSRPGHVVACRVADGGVLTRPGPAEAAADLVGQAGLRAVAAYSAIVSAHGSGELMGGDELADFAGRHRLPVVTVDDVVRWHLRPSLSA